MDEIQIRDLEARCIIGDNDWEREKQQDVVIDLDIRTDTRPAADTDDLDDALDYRALKKDVLAYVEDSDHRLLKTLTERIAEICLSYERAESVRVRVSKPGALRFARTVAIEIERPREQA
jgi:dihydroneopterin aldolase/D-erythro-7,8-dihydroneopterin triphosphate epimerase